MELQGEARLFDNRGNSPRKSPVRKKLKAEDVLASNVCHRLTFDDEEEDETVTQTQTIPCFVCGNRRGTMSSI